jgi:FMN phosphatase YigB (HAD superfamily)
MKTDIETIFIDWDGTLCNDRLWRQWVVGSPQEQTAHKYIQENFFQFDEDGLVMDWLRGQKTAEDIAQLLSEKVNLDASQIIDSLKQSCQTMAFINPIIPELINRLSQRGRRTIISTDNMDCFTRWTAPALNLTDLFDGILTSANLGVMKFETDATGQNIFFGRYLKVHKLNPNNCLLIDDSLKGKKSLKNLGMHYALIDQHSSLVDVLESLL